MTEEIKNLESKLLGESKKLTIEIARSKADLFEIRMRVSEVLNRIDSVLGAQLTNHSKLILENAGISSVNPEIARDQILKNSGTGPFAVDCWLMNLRCCGPKTIKQIKDWAKL